MTSFEALYGTKCRTPINWDKIKDKITLSAELLKEMKDQVKFIKQSLVEDNNQQKICANTK